MFIIIILNVVGITQLHARNEQVLDNFFKDFRGQTL